MEKKAVVFMDYNGTFDDVEQGKGFTLIKSLAEFSRVFHDNVQIVVVTSCPKNNRDESIKDDLNFALTFFPPIIRKKFTYLIESDCKTICKINTESSQTFSAPETLRPTGTSKKDGVEAFLNRFDEMGEFTTCVFVGDSAEIDLEMMNAKVGSRQKYMILVNEKLLKKELSSNYPTYRLSQKYAEGQITEEGKIFSYAQDIQSKIGEVSEGLIVKSTSKSYGAGKGLDVVTSHIKTKERA